jgi:hypothetical protein
METESLSFILILLKECFESRYSYVGSHQFLRGHTGKSLPLKTNEGYTL